MLHNIMFNNPDHGVAIARAAKVSFIPGFDTCIARIHDGKLVGGMLYSGYTGEGGSVHMHVASFSPRWGTRDLVWVAFHYPFEQLLVKKIFAPVPVNNLKAKRLNSHLGFTVEHIIRDMFPYGDMLLMGMYRDGCDFLKWTPRTLRDDHGR